MGAKKSKLIPAGLVLIVMAFVVPFARPWLLAAGANPAFATGVTFGTYPCFFIGIALVVIGAIKTGMTKNQEQP